MIGPSGLVLAILPIMASPAAAERVLLREDYQVLQRDSEDRAACAVALTPDLQHAAALFVKIVDARGKLIRQVDAAPIDIGAGKGVAIDALAVGGPYAVTIAAKSDAGKTPLSIRHVLVGDIWILGGQSNMFGIDLIKEELPALAYLNMLNPMHIEKDSHWCAGLPPIHRIPEAFSPFVLRTQHPEYSEEKIRGIVGDKTPVGGIDCSYFFARKLHHESGVPIGLIPCAIGGALAIWNPDEREQNRYGFLQHHVEIAGGRVKGLLFFQGEQDAIFGDERETVTKPSLIAPISTYGDEFAKFVAALRKDFKNPDMPAIFAQICRHHNSPEGRSKGWEIIREAQRTIPEHLAHAHCVPSIDLDLMDGLHLDYDSLKRVGERMAWLALPHVKKGASPRSEIKLKSVAIAKDLRPRIAVEFSGVSGKLRAPGRPTGFVLKKKSTGELLDWIYKVEFDPARPNAVILHTTAAPKDDVVLFYGAGVAPYVNVVDENDMAVPAFGPIELK